MANEITQDVTFKPQTLYYYGASDPPAKNGMLANSIHLLTADNQQVNMLHHAHSHYALSTVSTDAIQNQFGQKSSALTDKEISIYVPPFVNRASASVVFFGEGTFTIKYGSSYQYTYAIGLKNETTDYLIAVGPGSPSDTNGISFSGNNNGTPSVEVLKMSKTAGLQIDGIFFSYYRNQYNIT